MKVHVETTARYVTRGGVATYVNGLLHGLRRVASPGIEVAELGWPVANFSYQQPGRAVRTLLREWGWAKLIAPRALATGDVVHHTALPIIPFAARSKHVVTLHDLAILRHPERFRAWQLQSGRRRLQKLRDADRVICVSRFTADEAMSLLGLPAAKLDVVHEGPGRPPALAPATRPTSVPAEFFLFVGSLEPGKNLELLRRIYVASARPLPPLVIAGARWAGVGREGVAPRSWLFLGHVDERELEMLYRHALALLFPSKYEGFGLPVLEAMARGCPVLCTPVASLPEVAGKAAAYASLTPEEFGAAMLRFVDEPEWRKDLGAAGIARASTFSWEKCAMQTIAVYQHAANRATP
jgi:glycosyltransferase involved in cell wall biosynthesis